MRSSQKTASKTTVALVLAVSGLFVYYFTRILFLSSSEVSTVTVSLSQTSSSPPTRKRAKDEVFIFIATKFTTPSLLLNETYLGVCPQEIQQYCRLTNNKSELPQSKALIYHLPQYVASTDSHPVNSDQIRVMFTMESPAHYGAKSKTFKSEFFNWTMTYRTDSDIHFPYAVMKRRAKAVPIDLDQLWSSKNHSLTAAWMVSNCDGLNKRNELVKAAQKAGLAVDIFGGCGQKLPDCERNGFHNPKMYECATQTLKNYKFYFAFENSNCRDYVTEKFYNSLRLYNVVPIVIRRKYLQDIGIPDDLFIALDDFHSMSDMISYVNRLKDDKEKYLRHHDWRRSLEFSRFDRNKGFCLLCERLRRPIPQTRTYRSLYNWYAEDACENHYADRFLE